MESVKPDSILPCIVTSPHEMYGDGLIANYSDPSLYINRELSWLHFNQRVLEEATRPGLHPLIEQAKFISIFSSNLDEYFMIRVAGIENQVDAGIQKRTIDGFTPAEQLEQIRNEVLKQLIQQHDCLYNNILPLLSDEGITFAGYSELSEIQKLSLSNYFRKEIFPVITPLAFDTGHPFPFMSNLSLNLAIELEDKNNKSMKFARV